MEYISAKEAALKWNITVRRVQDKCKSGRVNGARLIGHSWMIPADAPKPADFRCKEAQSQVNSSAAQNSFMPQCPNPLFTELFTVPGDADKIAGALALPVSDLAAMWLSLYRGDIDSVYKRRSELIANVSANDFYISAASDTSADLNSKRVASIDDAKGSKDDMFYTHIGTGFLLSVCAMYKGDLHLWESARFITAAAPLKSERQKDELSFYPAALDSALDDCASFPDWFRRGSFDRLPDDARASAWFFYAKYLLIVCKNFRRGVTNEKQKHAEAMRVLPTVLEPLISETKREGVYLAEIYLRLICAIGYYFSGDGALCAAHVDEAVKLALPDKLYGPLAEYAAQMGYTLYERLYAVDIKAFEAVKRLSAMLGDGWVKLHNAVMNHNLAKELTLREFEIASLAAHGMQNKEIAERLHLSVGTVKQTLSAAMRKAEVSSRHELGKMI